MSSDTNGTNTPVTTPTTVALDGGQMIWRVQQADSAVVEDLARTLDLPPIMARLLVNRGVCAPEAALRFLDPSLDHLHDPHCLPDVDKAVDRLVRALEHKSASLSTATMTRTA
jgi:hypothetical protein